MLPDIEPITFCVLLRVAEPEPVVCRKTLLAVTGIPNAMSPEF